MLKTFLRRNSRSRVFVQHFFNKIFCRVRHGVPVCWIKSKGLFKHVAEDFFVVVSLKRRVTTKEHEENNAETPHVTLLVVVALKHLWCDVVGSANHSLHSAHLLSTREALRQAEVN